MLLLLSVLPSITESESQVGWPFFVLVMAGILVIGWVFNAMARRALKGRRRRKRTRSAHKN